MKFYGVSSKFNFGQWEHRIYNFGNNRAAAEKWLNTEEYDFREREIMSKTEAIKTYGRRAVANAIDAKN